MDKAVSEDHSKQADAFGLMLMGECSLRVLVEGIVDEPKRLAMVQLKRDSLSADQSYGS